MTEFFNNVKAEGYKLKNLTGIHIANAITTIICIIGAILTYKFMNWNRGIWVDGGNDAGTIDEILGVSQGMSTGVFASVGVLILMISAASIAGHEYKTKTHIITRLYCPNKLYEFGSKLTVSLLYTYAWTFIMLTAGFIVAKIYGPDSFTSHYNLFTDNWGQYGKYLLMVTIYVLLIHGITFLVRSNLMAVIIMIVYTTFVETAIAFVPKVGSVVSDWLPIRSINNLLSFSADADPAWYISGLVVVAYVALVYGGGCFVEGRRDA